MSRVRALSGFHTVWSALQETVAQAHFQQSSLQTRRLPASVGTAWTTILWLLMDLFQGLPHGAFAVGMEHLLRSWRTAEKWSGVSLSCTMTRGSSFTTRMCGCGLRTERVHAAIKHFELRLQSSVPSRARCGAVRTFAGPASSTLFAPSLPPRLCKAALQSLLWSAASPEVPQERRPGIAHATPASTHGSPRSPRDQPLAVKERKSAASSTPRQAAREVPQHL